MRGNKVVFADLHNTGITVSYLLSSSFEIKVPYFAGKYECRIVDDSLEYRTISGDYTSICDALNQSEYVSKGLFFISGTADARHEVPRLEYCDITEKLVLGSEEIRAGNLSSEEQGILAFSGIRKLRFSLKWSMEGSVRSVKLQFTVDTANGCALDETIRSDVYAFTDVSKVSAVTDLDTDKLGGVFSGKFEKMESLTLGCTLHAEVTTAESLFIVEYPVKLALINTAPEICRFRSRHAASIDFGTTSTCAAIKTNAGIELLAISATGPNEDNKYENPTNLMVFNWDELYANWLNSSASMPILNKGTKIDYKNWIEGNSDRQVDFDCGYRVKDELGAEVPDKKTVNSILTLIKMIPYRIIQEKRQIKLVPFNNDNKYVYITTSPEAQNEENFDPIAFYAYLIGRAINDRSRHREVYTKFLVTSPVKFNPEIKAILRNSMLHGLSRAVPAPMRGSVEVEMRYDEPVAYIGAICGTNYFKVANETRKFAVYDFGGGTLDFSFGEVTNNQDGETAINVRMVGGRENFGGESLVERMTFRIYCANLAVMTGNDIPIEKPSIEQLPDTLDSKFVLSDRYSLANTNTINYAISRRIFEGRNVTSPCELNLYDRQGVEKRIAINFERDVLEGFLDKVIQESIDGFVREMNSAFAGDSGYKPEQVSVFLAGNSSKNKFVLVNMKKKLSGCIIQKPDDTASAAEAEAAPAAVKTSVGGRGAKKAEHSPEAALAVKEQAPVSSGNMRYAITPKTAVAIGQLKLNNFTVNIDTESFKLYVGIFNQGTGAFVTRLKKGESRKDWVRFKTITNGSVDVFYSGSVPVDGAMDTTEFRTLDLSGHEGKTLYIRMKDQYAIEYCAGDASGQEPIPGDAEIFVERFD